MAYNTIIQSGTFKGTGSNIILNLRADIDWMTVYNYYRYGRTDSGYGVEFQWFKGMADGDGLVKLHGAGTAVIDSSTNSALGASSLGFTRIDTSLDPIGALYTSITAISTATAPVVASTPPTGLANNDTVRLIDITDAPQLGGIDFTVNNVTGSHFTLPYMKTLSVAGTTGGWRRIDTDPRFYPPTRYISEISKATNAVVELTVIHKYTVGQAVRFNVPSIYGMTEINGLLGNIIDIGTNTITVDIDSTAFTTFLFPTAEAVAKTNNAYTPATIVPVGMTANLTYANILTDSTRDITYIGMKLHTGVTGPAGSSTSDVLYWIAGKSFSTNTIIV